MEVSPVIACIVFLAVQVVSIPIPNGLLGNPEVECGEDLITVVFNTQDVFQGKVFAKGFFKQDDCVSFEQGRRTTSIEIKRDGCGMTTERQVAPPGLLITVKILISFHPTFITKVDRGFEIQCFYMEAIKSVTYPITVSEVPFDPFQEMAEMPRCRYQVLEGGPTGNPATAVSVGDQLYHKWTCESSSPNLWCMTVYDCYVDDGSGTKIEIMDANGCSIDKFILQNLEYQSALMAGQEAHAFKFADSVAVNFQCSIRLDIRDIGGQCQRPTCPALRSRRATNSSSIFGVDSVFEFAPVAEIDVRSNEVDVMDPSIGSDDIGQQQLESIRKKAGDTIVARLHPDLQICLPLWQVGLTASLGLLFLITVTASVLLLYMRDNERNYNTANIWSTDWSGVTVTRPNVTSEPEMSICEKVTKMESN